MELLIYSPKTSSRLDYMFAIFFKQIVQLPYQVTNDPQFFKSYLGPCINYSLEERINDHEIWIPPHTFLFEQDIRPQPLSVKDYEGMPIFFQNNHSKASCPFDLFAAGFYLLSLYENYLPGPRDVHGRFTAKQSLAYQHGFLQRPLVDEYGLYLVQQLIKKHPELAFKAPSYAYTPTYDIDVSWAYGHRPLYRQLGSILRDFWKLDLANLSRRIAVQTKQQADPFYTFPYLDQLHEQYDLKPIYFFLLADYHGLDRNIHPAHPEQQELIRSIANKYKSGIHPGILSNQQENQFSKELKRYQDLTTQVAKHSRQHYLVLQFPQTYQRLLKNGIQHDYTLGYADAVGFRASIARPFPWYDLQKESISNLMIHPFACMDGALKRSTENQKDKIYQQVVTLISATKAVNGHFYTLWHNSSFSTLENWKNWKPIYEYIIEQALP
ncbi:MAG: polysaccharide deacetylase family protein [Saprospiraceae bacterium]